jgi:hypothetical protein
MLHVQREPPGWVQPWGGKKVVTFYYLEAPNVLCTLCQRMQMPASRQTMIKNETYSNTHLSSKEASVIKGRSACPRCSLREVLCKRVVTTTRKYSVPYLQGMERQAKGTKCTSKEKCPPRERSKRVHSK